MSQNKINVAVVDDDESFACALERRFRASGFQVRTYPSAEAFLASTMLPQPDCLVLDKQSIRAAAEARTML
jgi:FixJ family two-component response regulator